MKKMNRATRMLLYDQFSYWLFTNARQAKWEKHRKWKSQFYVEKIMLEKKNDTGCNKNEYQMICPGEGCSGGEYQ